MTDEKPSSSRHYEIGSRVFAVSCADKDSVRLYGFGTFAGYVVPTEQDIADAPLVMRPTLGMFRDTGITNPKIELDDDRGVAWGFMCWWGAESSAPRLFGDRTVKLINIKDISAEGEGTEGKP